jgi:hypothetical protein
VTVSPKVLVVLLDGLAHISQAIRRNDERQIALFHDVLPPHEGKRRQPRMA